MLLHFARHGESEANLTRTFSNRDLPHRLTARGIEDAQELAHVLGESGVSEIWASPVPRAIETAEVVASHLGLTYRTTEGLREFDVGRFEGTASDHGWEEYADVMRAWSEGAHDARVGGGESLIEIVRRLQHFLQGFIEREGGDDRVALIGHGGLYRVALPHIFADLSPDFAVRNPRGYGLLLVGEVKNGGLVRFDDEMAAG